MKSLNKVTLLGHIVADPELRTTKSGKKVSSFAVATNNEWFDHDGTLQKSVDYHRVVTWEKTAELVSKYLKKGSPVFLEGRLTNRFYEGKDKVKYYVTEILGTSIHIIKFEKEKKSVETEELAVV